MDLKQIEIQALDLSEEERAQLAQKLILSLEPSSEEDLDKQWLLEAKRRAIELGKPIYVDTQRKKYTASYFEQLPNKITAVVTPTVVSQGKMTAV